MKKFEVGQEVVRSKGDYVVGRVGKIIAIVGENRAQVEWYKDPKSKVSFDSLELTSIPYEITKGYELRKNGVYIKWVHGKYKRL